MTALFAATLAPAALAQATSDDATRAGTARRPTPAAERVGPDLDAWWQRATFYEIFVRSFADSTSGPLAGDGVGDLRGLIERLDYLNDGDPNTADDLGVTGIWLMPVAESPSYHGYDTTDYRRIDPDYGTNEDFKDLIAACEARGIRVIADLVLNHCSSRHPWFRAALAGDPAYAHWFDWRDEHPGWRGPWNQRVWHPVRQDRHPDAPGDFYYGTFYRGMPDLNYRNEVVTGEMFDVTRFWLTELGVHGFRLDAVRHLIEDGRVQENTPETHAWLRRFYAEVKRARPDALTVGEVWSNSDDVSRYVGDQMDLAFEFDTSDAILDSVRMSRADPLRGQLRDLDRLYPLGMYATFLRNHDQSRTLHALEGDIDKARLAASIQFALPGVPFIYYGEEIGMSATKPDPALRTPMPWTANRHGGFSAAAPWQDFAEGRESANVRTQINDHDSILSHYRRLIHLRAASDALRVGEVRLLNTKIEGDSDDRMLAFLRRTEGEAVLCVFNLSDRSVSGCRIDGLDGLTLRRFAEADRPERKAWGAFAPHGFEDRVERGERPVISLGPMSAALIPLEPR